MAKANSQVEGGTIQAPGTASADVILEPRMYTRSFLQPGQMGLGSIDRVDLDEPVTFFGIYKNLRFNLHEVKWTPEGDIESSKPVTIEFNNSEFTTRSSAVVDTLRKQKGFGGSLRNKFSDSVQSGQPMFFEGGFPEWWMKKKQKDDEGLTKDPSQYEQGADHA